MSQIRVLGESETDNAVSLLLAGGLLGLPTETVYGLAAKAMDEKSVRRIYEVKGRPLDHPVIVHIGTFEELDVWGDEISDEARILAEKFWPGPLTLVVKRKPIAGDWLTGGQETVALRMPSHPVALKILQALGTGVAAPSANKFGSVSPTSAQHVIADLSAVLDATRDAIIDGGSSEVGLESTILNCTVSHPVVLRPGAITQNQIDEVLNSKVEFAAKADIKAPGLLASHYAPNARVVLANSEPELLALMEKIPSDKFVGLIALEKIGTPNGCIRLAMPHSNMDYAQVMYEAMRAGDLQNLQTIVVVLPAGDDIAIAIRDRLTKAAHQPN
jgi:L-threonylcarbamoyladenylate synthase